MFCKYSSIRWKLWEEFGRSRLATRVHVHVAKFSCNATTVSYKRLYIVSKQQMVPVQLHALHHMLPEDFPFQAGIARYIVIESILLTSNQKKHAFGGHSPTRLPRRCNGCLFYTYAMEHIVRLGWRHRTNTIELFQKWPRQFPVEEHSSRNNPQWELGPSLTVDIADLSSEQRKVFDRFIQHTDGQLLLLVLGSAGSVKSTILNLMRHATGKKLSIFGALHLIISDPRSCTAPFVLAKAQPSLIPCGGTSPK